MATNKHASIRYQVLDECLRKKSEVNTQKNLRDYCCSAIADQDPKYESAEVSLRTFRSDIAYIKSLADKHNVEVVIDYPEYDVEDATNEEIINMLNDQGVESLKYIFLTHCHADHIGGVPQLKDAKGGKILISRADAEGLYNPEVSLAPYIDMPNIELEADSRIDDEDLIHIGNLEFQVISTPGHTKGSVCLYYPEGRLVFTGDTIFSGSWGRTDLPTGNFVEIMNSISNRLMVLPDETIVYPGHR